MTETKGDLLLLADRQRRAETGRDRHRQTQTDTDTGRHRDPLKVGMDGSSFLQEEAMCHLLLEAFII